MAVEKNREADNLPVAGKQRRLTVGVLAVIILVAAGSFLWLRPAGTNKIDTPPGAADSIGLINVKKVLQAHSQGEKLVELRGEQGEMEEKLRFLQQQLLRLMAPQLDKKPFQDAARQKTTQAILKEHGDFLAELDRQEKAKRAELRPEYEKARDEINELFLLEIFNIRLKLDNAESMKLSEEAVKSLEAKLKDLQHQRGVRQKELWHKYEQGIRSWKEAEAAKKGIDISYQWQELEASNLSAELKKRSEAQQRNLQALQQNTKQRVALRQQIAELQLAVRNKKSEADALEKEIMQSISGKAAKLAMLHNLGVILADKSESRRIMQDGLVLFQKVPVTYHSVINVKSVNLTDELIKELKASK